MTAKSSSGQSPDNTNADVPDSQAGDTPSTAAVAQSKAEAHARAVAQVEERQKLAARMEELKTERLRRQVMDMEAETRAAEEDLGGDTEDDTVADAKTKAKSSGSVSQPPVPRARARFRHFIALLTFGLMVVVPIVASGWYLWNRAQDRYVSYAGFSVRTEEIGSSFELLTGVAEISGSSSSDTDILYKFIQSPELVALIDAQLDLRAMWSRPGQDWTNGDHDPVFSYNPEGAFRTALSWGLVEAGREALPDMASDAGTIEDLTAYWERMVKVYSDSGTGLIDLEVQAFSPDEARTVAQLIYDESSEMINRLSAISRDDATRYARDELDQAQERLTKARQALVRFRLSTGIVDPNVTIQEQQGLLIPLQGQLAQTLIDLDVQRQTTREGDPRLLALERRVEVIESRIAEERRSQGLTADTSGQGDDSESFAVNLAEYERLSVNLEFAQAAYLSAQGGFDKALSEAQRQNRYLAAHVNPTLAESATHPKRETLLGLVALFSFLIWAVLVLSAYALRDRR